MNWKSFAFGFVVGVALLSAISHWRVRPQNVIASWPDDDNKKAMQILVPWITKARTGKLGPFIIMAPKSFDSSPEAMLQPAKGKSPWIYFTGSEIMIHDSKKRAISVNYEAKTGEFRFYSYSPDLVAGPSFVDKRMTGVLEKIELPVNRKRSSNQEKASAQDAAK